MTDVTKGTDSEYFDVAKVLSLLTDCLVDDGDVRLGPYLQMYQELLKFCHLMGSVFTFVGSEISSKSEILEELKRKDDLENFSSVKKMIKYEMESGLLTSGDYVSGCRTLLRLNRGLDFIRLFLRKVYELGPDDGTSKAGTDAYNKTLARHHPWLVRQGAHLAMYILPSKQTLLHRVCGDRHQEALQLLPSMLDSANEVYERAHTCYRNNNLLDLP